MRIIEDRVDEMNTVLFVPDDAARRPELALWLTHLGGSAEKERDTMTRIADAGCAVVSFDPPAHGRRADTDDMRAFANGVLASFRQRMWPLLGRTTLEALRVITWAETQLGGSAGPVVAGGVSMGGDVAIALAGIDDRVRRVATVGSSPDWERPGMRSLGEPTELIDQGHADPYAAWFADQLNPSRHLDRFQRDLTITFELGREDRHVPADNATRFKQALAERDPAAADRVHITLHDDLDHLGVATDERALQAAVDRLVPTG